MARKLIFQQNERAFEFVINKVDRNKLYGKKEIVVTDSVGNSLNKGYLDEWGSVVIASSGMGYLDDGRCWHAKSELLAVDEAGNALEIAASSFDAPINLSQIVSLESFMEHEVTAVYQLKGPDIAALAERLSLADGLYSFPFCYRASYEVRAAFLNPVDGSIFMIVGSPTKMTLLSKPQHSEIEEEFEDDALDFSMM